MSRHTIPNNTRPDDTLVVGWDAPLATYYAHRHQAAADPYDEPTEVFWVGETPCELPTVQDLMTALAEHDEQLPEGLAAQLDADRLAEGTRFIGRPATGLIAAVALETVGPEQADRIRAELAPWDDGTCGDCMFGRCHGTDPDDCGCDRHEASVGEGADRG